jgi:hypothetical protein
VQAGEQARRYFVLDVSEEHRRDKAYFGPIFAQMDNGGDAAMLYDLLHYDLSNFDHRNQPQTLALTDQKISSFKGPIGWLYECLQNGQMGEWDWWASGLTKAKDDLYSAYLVWSREQKEYKPAPIGQWREVLNKVLKLAVKDSRPRIGGRSGPRHLAFASLTECRTAFAEYLGSPVKWDVDPTDPTDDPTSDLQETQ